MNAQQMVLPFGTRHDASFETFFGDNNQRTGALLAQWVDDPDELFAYLMGADGTGKTHLAIAALNRFEERGFAAAYFSLAALEGADAEQLGAALDSVAGAAFVVLEDVQFALGLPDKEQRLFDCFNELRMRGVKLLVTAHCTVEQLDLSMPDLRSRFKSGLTLRLNVVSDDDKLEILAGAARELGLDLSDEVSRYIIRRSSRNLDDLLSVLSQLDKAAWTQKHKISIPFVKKEMAW